MGYLRSFRGHLDSPDSNMISTIYSAPQKTYKKNITCWRVKFFVRK